VKFLPAWKFLVFTHGSTDDSGQSMYGRSDFLAAWRYYWSNLILQKLENVWLERWTDPVRWGKYPAHMSPAQKTEALTALEDLGRVAAALIPEGVDVNIDWAAATSGLNSPFDTAMKRNAASIARALLVGDLVQGKGDKGGFALGKVHFETFLLVVESAAKMLSSIIDRFLVRPLIKLNFSDHGDIFPMVTFSAANMNTLGMRTAILKDLAAANFVDPREEWVRGWVGLPDMDPEFKKKRDKELEDILAQATRGEAGKAGQLASNATRAGGAEPQEGRGS